VRRWLRQAATQLGLGTRGSELWRGALALLESRARARGARHGREALARRLA
jgi:hypothetical protein